MAPGLLAGPPTTICSSHSHRSTLLLRLVLSFLCIVLAYDGIAGEAERGTLRLVLAYPISPSARIALRHLIGACLSCTIGRRAWHLFSTEMRRGGRLQMMAQLSTSRVLSLVTVVVWFQACGGSDEPAVETWIDGNWTAVVVNDYTIAGKRDGQKTSAVATYELQEGAQLRVELEVSYNPQPVLSGGRWVYTGETRSAGIVVERSMKFFGGQGEGPSLGGRFRLDEDGQPRFRIVLPLRPVSQPTWR
ncbi:MAG TPA: hypothetical protein DIC52_04170 [Candidatus Latescibacteria bacterium]|nr:hypothetical protein [Candidatus Latescibacterota bacterium]